MAALVDTNVLVYRFDPRFPAKQRAAVDVLRRGIAGDTLRLPHQAIVEFVAVVTRRLGKLPPLLSPEDARREAEELLGQFEVLYPNEALVRWPCAVRRPISSRGSTRTCGLTPSTTACRSCCRRTSSTAASTAACAWSTRFRADTAESAGLHADSGRRDLWVSSTARTACN